jgi:excisionase family DNA binding protein
MSEKPLFTPEEVATSLRVTRRTVYEWLKIGRLRGLRVGRGWRIRPEDVEAFTHLEPGIDVPLPRAADTAPITPEERPARVDALMGKYAWVPTSSEEFARRKREEIDLENRRWEQGEDRRA